MLYAELFVANSYTTELSVMTPRTYVRVQSVFAGWLVSCVGLLLSFIGVLVARREQVLWGSLLLSSIYAVPLGVLYAFQAL